MKKKSPDNTPCLITGAKESSYWYKWPKDNPTGYISHGAYVKEKKKERDALKAQSTTEDIAEQDDQTPDKTIETTYVETDNVAEVEEKKEETVHSSTCPDNSNKKVNEEKQSVGEFKSPVKPAELVYKNLKLCNKTPYWLH